VDFKRKKVLVFAHDSSLYGASQSLFTLLTELKEFDILVILPYGGKIEALLKQAGIKYQIVNFPIAAYPATVQSDLKRYIKGTLRYYKHGFNALKELTAVVQSFKPDIIYTNTSVVNMGYRLAARFKIPHVWHIREFGDLDYNLRYRPSKSSLVSGMKKSAKVIFVSRALYGHWFKKELANAAVIYNGIKSLPKVVNPRKYPEMQIAIGMLGSILPGKGQNTAIKAFGTFHKAYPNSVLKIYGDVSHQIYADELQKLCIEHQIADSVKFMGFEMNQDVIYDNLDLLLNCSTSEAFGRTLIEAMGRGVPVIARGSGGILEIIDDRTDGMLFNGTSDNLAQKMLELFTNRDLYLTLSVNAIEKVTRQFSFDKYVASVKDVLNSVE
jgi:glycosyltransferase involved in cell wall biosynthesis